MRVAGLEDLLAAASPFAQQLEWGVGQPIMEAVLAPMLSELTQKINARSPVQPLSPADLADLVVRSFMEHGQAAAVAARSGVNAEDFGLLVKGAGNALDTTSLIEAYRRKKIPWDAGSPEGTGVLQGIAQGRLDTKWAPVVQALGDVPIGVADAVDAVVEGQISMAQGEEFAYQNGISAENFRILYNTRGNPPSPTQLAEMVHRGAIPLTGTGPDVLSFEQGISEGATKNKWIKAFEAVMPVLPPARTITALQHNGTITAEQAADWYRQLGLPEEVSAAYVKDASHKKTAAARTLVKGDVLKLYADRLITRPEALAMLQDLGYEAHEAEFELEIEDFHQQSAARASAVSKVRSLYVARRISDVEVVGVLGQLGVGPDERDQLLAVWKLERNETLRILTPAEVVDAWEYQVMSTDVALVELQALGYTEYDAWVKLSIKNKGPIGTAPPGAPSPSDRV